MWFLLALAVVIGFLLIVLWSVGLFFHLAAALLWFITGLLLLTGVAILLVRYLLQRHRGSQIAGAILEQGKQQIEAAPPEKQKELEALQQGATSAIATLKRGHAGNLYVLPWYIIVGPPGAGKTTAVKESGLPFPLEKSLRGTGGTRNCHWWFGNDAVLLDTAGRYTTHDEDREEWLAFLDITRRHRPRKPIDGLLVALSITDLAGAQQEEIAAIARTIRARLDEVMTRLKMLVPVYLIFTKADLIAGFIEFWGDLRPSEREQAWGMTFPVDRTEEPKALFEHEFDVLVSTLYGRQVRRLQSERRVHMRRALWIFPQEFAALRSNLAGFVSELFAQSHYQQTPLLRGVYFTSGTQTERSSSRALASMGSAFGLRASGEAPTPVDPKSYFLNGVFRRIIFPDRQLAGRTEAEKRRQLLLRVAAAALTGCVSIALLLPGTVTWAKNRQLVASVAAVDGRLREGDWSSGKDLDKKVTDLNAGREQLVRLAGWKDSGPPPDLRWGMYVGNGLYASLRGEYAAAVGRLVVVPAKRQLEASLRAMSPDPVRDTDDYDRDFDALKLYLMLGNREHMDAEWAAPRLLRAWGEASPSHGPDEQNLLLPHVKEVLDLLHRGELPPWDLDEALATRARSILGQVPQMERLYDVLTRDANASLPPIRREMIFYGASAKFVQSKKGVRVPGAYTKAGWQRVRKLLGEERSKLAAEQWVLGDSGDEGSQATIDKHRELYFARYQEAWRSFLGDLSVQDPGNGDVAIDELNALSEPEWPYLRLVRTVSENVTLDVSDDRGLVEKAVDKAKGVLDGGSLAPQRVAAPVERAFRPMIKFAMPPAGAPADNQPPTGLSQYVGLLEKLVGALTDLHDAETGTDPGKISDVFQEAVRSTSALLSEQDGFTRPLLSPLLMQPITLAWRDVVHDTGGAVDADWQSSVWTQWHEKLEGKYPFARSPTDATLDDVLTFFAPGQGTLWSFFDQALTPTLERSGTSFVPTRRFRSSIDYAPEFLDVCLKRGRQITDVLFPPRSDHAAVTFDVNLHGVSPTVGEVTLEVDGATHTYRNEPEQWLAITWPGKGQHGARLSVRGSGGMSEDIERPGDFGLFRLLDSADIKPGRAGGHADGAPTLVATWNLNAATDAAFVSIDLRPARDENPLMPGFFRDYQCPRDITSK